jgi:hypothetical protein
VLDVVFVPSVAFLLLVLLLSLVVVAVLELRVTQLAVLLLYIPTGEDGVVDMARVAAVLL